MSEKGNLLIETFEAESAKEIDKKVNAFREKNNIFFMEPRINMIIFEGVIKKYYTYVVYYLPKGMAKKEEMKKCPKCGIDIPTSYEFHLKCGWRGDNEK
mgnify:FL=1